jgi:hypothetical protein
MPGANGGVLQVGNPGNVGGTGRPPSAIRETARQMFDERLPTLGLIADSAEEMSTRDRLKAIEILGKFGLEETVSVRDVRTALDHTATEIRAFMPEDQAEALITRIRPHWLRL